MILCTAHLAHHCWRSGRSDVDAAKNRNCLNWQLLQENGVRNPSRVCGPSLDAWNTLPSKASRWWGAAKGGVSARETAGKRQRSSLCGKDHFPKADWEMLSLLISFSACPWMPSLLIFLCLEIFQWQCDFIRVWNGCESTALGCTKLMQNFSLK